MATQTKMKSKPQAATAKNAPKAATVKPQQAATQAAPQAQAQAAKPQAAQASAKSLFWLAMTPGGNALRAYFLALIYAQTGGAKADVSFRLWPNVNIGGHLATGRIVRDGRAFKFTTQGVNYFTDPKQAPDAESLTVWDNAVRTGQAPKGYGSMVAFKE